MDDHHFARYEDHPQPDRGLAHSFAFGLMMAGFGLIFAILFIFLH